MKKNRIILVVGIILILLSLLSYGIYKLVNGPAAEVVSLKKYDEKDIKNHYHEFVKTAKDINIYQKRNSRYEKVGTIYQDETIQLGTVTNFKEAYFPIKDSDYFVFYKDIIKFDNPLKLNSSDHYVPYAKTVTSKKTTVFSDQDGKKVIRLEKPITEELIVKEETRVGINYLGRLLYASTDSVELKDQQQEVKEVATEVPVLMYHFFYSETDGSKALDSNFLSQQKLEGQLKYLTENGYYGATMNDVALFLEGKIQLPQKTVAITIDDGSPTVYPYAYPLFQKYQFHATLFLITSWIGDGTNYLDKQLEEMSKSPYIEMQSHSHNMHRGGCPTGKKGIFQCIDESAGLQDLEATSKFLGSKDAFCYPFGDVSASAEAMLKKSGYRTAYTTQPGRVNPSMNPYQLPRVRISTNTSQLDFQKLVE